MTDSPTLNSKERPTGVVASTAMCIGWLQDGLDYFHHRFPFGAAIKTVALVWVTSQETYALPTDFIQDYRDGIILATDKGRMIRKGLGSLLDLTKDTEGQFGKPAWYAIVANKVYIRPLPSSAYNGTVATLYYYSLPAVLASGDVPTFPSDIVLVRYAYLRGLEWTRAVPPGSAEQYAESVIASLQKSGIGLEAEDDHIPLDRSRFPGSRVGSDPDSWMGSPIVEGP